MSDYQFIVCKYNVLVALYNNNPYLFEQLAENNVKFKDVGANLSSAMLKLGRTCFTLLEEHSDGRTDCDKSFDENGIYRLVEDIVVKAKVHPVNNIWHFNFKGQLFRLHEAPSIVGYLGVEFVSGDFIIPVKSLAASIIGDGRNIDPIRVSPMPAFPKNVLFFTPLMQMLQKINGVDDDC